MFSLSRYYRNYSIVPSLLATLVGLFLLFTHNGSGYSSEWAVDDGFALTVFLCIGLSWAISISALLLMLNDFDRVRHNYWLSAIVWLVLPCSICIWVLFSEAENLYSVKYLNEAYYGSILIDIYVSLIAFLHIVFLAFGFRNFRKELGRLK